MKRLYLLRHAKTLPLEGFSQDFDRKLAPQGQSDAHALGALMTRKSYIPDLAYHSAAIRTSQTYAGLTLDGVRKTVALDSLYDAGAGDIFSQIQDSDDKFESILVVGHNPAIHEITLRLCEESDGLFDRLIQGYQPGTLSVLDCPVQVWNDLQLGENMLIDLQEPTDYNGEASPRSFM